MDEELIRELQRLYAHAIERSYTVKEVKDKLTSLGISIEVNCPSGIMEEIRKLISVRIK